MSNALTVYDGGGFELMQRAAQAMTQSGYFKDSADVAKAVVKVMAGAELGIAPFAAMTGIHIVNGRPTLSSNLIATLVKNSGRYDYRVKLATDTECVLTWLENGQSVGESRFTIKEAHEAQLTGKSVWKQYPSDMLFARALTRGARRFAPGIFGGAPVYTAEEVGADDTPDGDVIPGEWQHEQQPPESPQPAQDAPQAPQPPDNGQSHLDEINADLFSEQPAKQAAAIPTKKPTPAMVKKFHALGTEVYGDEWDDKRPEITRAVSKGRRTSSTYLTQDEMSKLIDGMEAKKAEAAS